jgi:hypothetical protein
MSAINHASFKYYLANNTHLWLLVEGTQAEDA